MRSPVGQDEADRAVRCRRNALDPGTMGFFVLIQAGWDRVRAYDAAMAEWANARIPLIT